MVLRASALTTVAAVNAELSSDSGLEHRADAAAVETVLERMIQGFSGQMASYCNRRFERVTDQVELITTIGDQYIRLMHAPIVSVTSIEWLDRDGEVLEELVGWTIEDDGAAGLVYFGNGFPVLIGLPLSPEPSAIANRVRARIRVTYTGGFITPPQEDPGPPPVVRDLPEQIEEQCIREVVSAFWNRNRNRDIDSRTSDIATTTYRERRGLLPSTKGVLDEFWLGNPTL